MFALLGYGTCAIVHKRWKDNDDNVFGGIIGIAIDAIAMVSLILVARHLIAKGLITPKTNTIIEYSALAYTTLLLITTITYVKYAKLDK